MTAYIRVSKPTENTETTETQAREIRDWLGTDRVEFYEETT